MFSIECVLYRMGEAKWQTSVPLSRYIWSCRGRARAGRGTKGCPLRASKRFVGEFAHASHTGIPCPARAWNKKLPYRAGKGFSVVSESEHQTESSLPKPASTYVSGRHSRKLVYESSLHMGDPHKRLVCEFYRPFMRSSHVG